MHDRRGNVVRKSNVVETRAAQPSTPPLLAVHRELDHRAQPVPFAFPPALHGYMFQGIVPGSGGGGLIRFRRPWKGTFHTYLQDAARRNVIYYLPDQFKVARRREAPYTPFITVRVTAPGGLPQDADVVFDYIIAPYTDPKRLADARSGLPGDPAFSGPDVASLIEFQPFVTSDVRYFVDRPTQHGTAREERAGAALVLQGALKDTIVMKLPDFQVLFDAMHRSTASLFLGRVQIEVPGQSAEVIPFSARLEDLEGEMFLYTAQPNAAGGVDVSLTNAIESPLRINALDATISRAGQTSNGSIQGLALPVASLASGASVTMSVSPQTPLPPGVPEVRFSLDGVGALPDPAAIWDSILDRSTLEYFDTITVKALPSLFEPLAGRENEKIEVILVEFEGGGTAELKADQLEQQVRIDYPIDDVILRRAVDTSYRYTVTVIRKNGRQDRDAAPRQAAGRILFVSVTM
jgi:hypothetical protein